MAPGLWLHLRKSEKPRSLAQPDQSHSWGESKGEVWEEKKKLRLPDVKQYVCAYIPAPDS